MTIRFRKYDASDLMSNPMKRRTFVAAASSLAVGLAGCSELGTFGGNNSSLGFGSDGGDGSGSGSGRSPAETIRQFYAALDEGDAETAASLIHPEAPDQGEAGFDQEMVQQMADTDLTVEGTELVAQNDTRAVVNTTLSITVNGAPRTNSVNIELRSDGGTWKIYGPAEDTNDPTATATATESAGDGPEAVIRRFYDRVVAGNTAGAIELIHPDTPAREELRSSVENTGSVDEFQVRSTSIVERSDRRAVVRIEFTVTVDGDTRDAGERFELRTADGAWKIYAYGQDIEEPGTAQETETPAGGEGGDSVAGDPANVVREFYTALGAGDADTVRELLHPESPERAALDSEQIEESSQFDPDVAILGVKDLGGRARVTTEITIQVEGDTQTNPVAVELRPADGRWRIYEIR